MFLRLLFGALPVLLGSTFVDPPWVREWHCADALALFPLVPTVHLREAPPIPPPPTQTIITDPPTGTMLSVEPPSVLSLVIGPIIALLVMFIVGWLVSRCTRVPPRPSLSDLVSRRRSLLAQVHGRRIASLATASWDVKARQSRSKGLGDGLLSSLISYFRYMLAGGRWTVPAMIIMVHLIGFCTFSPPSIVGIAPLPEAIDCKPFIAPSTRVGITQTFVNDDDLRITMSRAASVIHSTPTVNQTETVISMATAPGLDSVASSSSLFVTEFPSASTPTTPTVISMATVTWTATGALHGTGTSTHSADISHAPTPAPQLTFDLLSAFKARITDEDWITETEHVCDLQSLPASEDSGRVRLYSHCLVEHILGEHEELASGRNDRLLAAFRKRFNKLWISHRLWDDCHDGFKAVYDINYDIQLAQSFSRCMIDRAVPRHEEIALDHKVLVPLVRQ